MADTQRTRAALQALFADNTTGQISAQDLRDFLVTALQPEFVNANDFWCSPQPDQLTTDLTTRGDHWYSQIAASDASLSFGKPCALTVLGTWSTANASQISCNAVLGIPADSYASAASNCKILRWGIVYDSSLANRLTGQVGLPLFLFSATDNSFSYTNADAWSRYIGYILPAGVGSVQTKGKFFFDPFWGVATGA
uniref:Uncharacterized protein n=1 Tax=viral metagenome TaxID=1070528 RepID=A0A6M3ITQ4_9ZZZZ